jgi:RNA polymerase sigma-70 factor (ECF subfamily)
MNGASEDGPAGLLRQAREGDRQALGRLLDSYRGYLRVLARLEIGRRLQGKADASDVVQEVYLRAHNHFDQFRGGSEGELAAWLRQILANALADLVRHYHGRRRRDVRLERDLAGGLDHSSQALADQLSSGGPSPSEQASDREQAVRVVGALDRLPEHYSQVLILRHLQGLPFAEVARQMQRSPDSVEKLYARALIRLRQEMEGHHASD